MELYQCRSCGGPLSRVGECYVCKFCGNKWEREQEAQLQTIDLINAWGVLREGDFESATEQFEAVLVENDPCTVDHGGLLRWVSTNIRDERNAVLFSDPIAQALRREGPSRAILFNRKTTSELYLCFDTRIFVYHYGMKRFYYYELPLPVRFLCEDEKEMFFGMQTRTVSSRRLQISTSA